eukprot:TRINITY_DN15369_c0_g1_i7.p1 TRINITY_DN15369_c0_g1~~TRINITY_DN15369_c0_g1_i7.p1  ORF type:complete len:281 (+),score=50.16 TRINITY_DN15369_c0_g1_i7:588-1430(+)
MTGGMAPVLRTADEVYRATYKRTIERNRKYYKKYPGDVSKVREIVKHLDSTGGVPLPSGGILTARRFLSVGLHLGFGSGMENIHFLVESAFVTLADGSKALDYRFLRGVESMQDFDTNPMYWLMHETIYCGPSTGASNWAAQRYIDNDPDGRFNYRSKLASAEDEPILFTGEMVYPWLAEDYATLGDLKEAAEILAAKSDWTSLYNLDKLKETSVPVAAAVYYDDMFVERKFSEEVAELLGDRCKLWITNEYQHSGVHDGGDRVMDTLMKMLKNELSIPS